MNRKKEPVEPATKEVWLEYRTGVGYFWGPGHPTKKGQPATWTKDNHVVDTGAGEVKG